jgi:hypothetical protein
MGHPRECPCPGVEPGLLASEASVLKLGHLLPYKLLTEHNWEIKDNISEYLINSGKRRLMADKLTS